MFDLKKKTTLFLCLGANAGKLAFISWIPDDCSVKQRMVNAACKVYLKNKLEGVAEDGIHATSLSDLDYDEILTTVSKGKAKLNWSSDDIKSNI